MRVVRALFSFGGIDMADGVALSFNPQTRYYAEAAFMACVIYGYLPSPEHPNDDQEDPDRIGH